MSKKTKIFLFVLMIVGIVVAVASIIVLAITNIHWFAIGLFVGVVCIMASLCFGGTELYFNSPKKDKDDSTSAR